MSEKQFLKLLKFWRVVQTLDIFVRMVGHPDVPIGDLDRQIAWFFVSFQMTLISSQSNIWEESFDQNTERCCLSVRTVALLLHAISIIRSECPDHGVWHPDVWTYSAWLALPRIAFGREWRLDDVWMVLPRCLDECTWTLDSSRTLNSVRTICHYVQKDVTLNSSKLLDIEGCPDEKFLSTGRMMLWQMSVQTAARKLNWLFWILHRVFLKLITEV